MFFDWLKQRRRKRLAARPFPDEWTESLRDNVRHFRSLNASEQRKVRNVVQVFVAEKNWEGCGGLAITDVIKVTIAGQIAILVLGFDQQYFDAVLSILVYPDSFLVPESHIASSGVVTEGNSAREGEAWHRGPVILSWSEALAGGRGDSPGHNLVFHEFAHQLDMLNGQVADGTPALQPAVTHERWTSLISDAFETLRHDCAHGRPSVFDCYGATSVTEFFAVATETFFEEPREFKRRDAELYAIFTLYYQQDPLSRYESLGCGCA